MNNLLLITGAGASYDVINVVQREVDLWRRPPLTRDLFNVIEKVNGESQVAAEHLYKYPFAAQLGYEFQLKFSSNDKEKNLEQFLAEKKNSKYVMTKNQYWSVPLYLHDLFNDISNNYLPTKLGVPSNYKSLIDAINESKYNQVVWLNLNYDLLADKAIRASTDYSALHNFDSYMQLKTPDNKLIKYTKPHGSIDWFMQIDIPTVNWEMVKSGKLPIDFADKLSKQIYTRKQATSVGIPFPDKWYPAISAPLGEYEFIYQEHIKVIIPDLQNTTDILCIGFSALDEDILNLVKQNIPRIKKLKIVNGSEADGRETHLRLVRYYGRSIQSRADIVFNGGFTKFISEGMNEWLAV